MQVIIKPFLWVMDFCYSLCHNYGLAIILFTLISKIILLPLAVWVQRNSIKMVKMQPDLYEAKTKFFGDRERIAEETSAIYKKNKYNPFATVIPTIIQLFLLICIIEVIKVGINSGNFDMNFLGFSLDVIPRKVWGWYILSPLLAALSSLVMSLYQNKSNVIQEQQSIWGQLFTLLFSVGLSLYLGFFVTVGVVVYWICSNLFSILQLFILNIAINPKKYVDYELLEEKKAAYKELENLGSDKKGADAKENAKREKADYKRFFSVVNKHVVFYSESNGFYKYFSALIDFLMDKTNLTIHYITSDPNDNIFKMAEENSRIRAYYIGEKRLITLMMKMDADMVLMTMPDLDNYHIKRSYVRKDIEYVFVQHSLGSINLMYRKGALDHFDSILCPSKAQKEEVLALEKLYNLPPKKIVECGYFVLDDMIKAYEEMDHTPSKDGLTKVLIAPSWQDDNIVDSCLDELLEQLSGTNYRIIVRPHPQHVRHRREKLEALKERYASNDRIEVQLDFSATDTVWKADILITDWSNISMEYAFCTKRPVLFINTPMKIMNPEWERIDITPLNLEIRHIVGTSVNTDELDKVPGILKDMEDKMDDYAKAIEEYETDQIYNLGGSAKVGGEYIMERLLARKQSKTQQ